MNTETTPVVDTAASAPVVAPFDLALATARATEIVGLMDAAKKNRDEQHRAASAECDAIVTALSAERQALIAQFRAYNKETVAALASIAPASTRVAAQRAPSDKPAKPAKDPSAPQADVDAVLAAVKGAPGAKSPVLQHTTGFDAARVREALAVLKFKGLVTTAGERAGMSYTAV